MPKIDTREGIRVLPDMVFLFDDSPAVVNALIAMLSNSSTLVNRSTLDFMIQKFDPDTASGVVSDFDKLLRAAVRVLLKRDMSLNRRVFAWIKNAPLNGVFQILCSVINVSVSKTGTTGGRWS
jgi:Dopey, N-terminal